MPPADRGIRSLEVCKDALTTAGFRFTRQREAIIRILSQAGARHLSADEIARTARISDGLGLATVYRTLAVLEEVGAIKSIDLGDGRNRYEMSGSGEHYHHHLVCTVCGGVEEVDRDFLQQIEEHARERHGFTVMDHSLKLYGVCRRCRADGRERGS